MKNNLKDKIKFLPKSPGVYQFVDSFGGVLYVGKAKNINSRIKSYFLKDVGRGPVIDLMIKEAADIKCLTTDSEIEAVLLEADLVNKFRPKYNTKLKDDKSFFVVKITKSVVGGQRSVAAANCKLQTANYFPPVELVRFKNVDFSDKTAEYFGPYPSGLLLKKSLNHLRKIFPFRDCSKTKFSAYKKKGRPCIFGDIRVCSSPCVGWVNEDQYKKNIFYLKNFLKGKKQIIARNLKSEMNLLSEKRRYEEASLVRDKFLALGHLNEVAIGLRDDVFSRENIFFKRIECYDVSNILGFYAVGSMIVFIDGKKSTDDYRKFKIKFSQKPNDLLMMREILRRRFKNKWPTPDLLVVDGGVIHLAVAKEVLKNNNLNIPVASISKGVNRDKNEFHFGEETIARYIKKNDNLQSVLIQARDEAHRFSINYYRLLHKKGLFK